MASDTEFERRELGGIRIISPSDHEAVVPKGGLLRLDGAMEVRFLYRGQVHSVLVAPEASEETVRSAIAARIAELDEAFDLAELIGLEVEA